LLPSAACMAWPDPPRNITVSPEEFCEDSLTSRYSLAPPPGATTHRRARGGPAWPAPRRFPDGRVAAAAAAARRRGSSMRQRER